MSEGKLPNHSYFWRHPAQMEALTGHLSRLPVKETLRVWCAGCSRGEEAYSLSYLLHRLGRPHHIRATDKDEESLAQAVLAIYREETFRLLPRAYEIEAVGDSRYTVAPEVRRSVDFERSDLLKTRPPQAAYHVVVCRNVLIYFDKGTQLEVLNKLVDALLPNGLLVLGYAESSLIEHSGLTRLDQHGIFQARTALPPRRPPKSLAKMSEPEPVVEEGRRSVTLGSALKDFAHGDLRAVRSKLNTILSDKKGFLAGHYFLALVDLEEEQVQEARSRVGFILENRNLLDDDTQNYLSERGVSGEQFFRSTQLIRERIEAGR